MAAQSTASVQFQAFGNPMEYNTAVTNSTGEAIQGGYVSHPEQFAPAQNQEQGMEADQVGATRAQRRGKA